MSSISVDDLSRPFKGDSRATERVLSMDRRVQKVIELIKDNPERELSMDEMAMFVNLSPSRLRFMFKSETGRTPAQYIKSLRIEQAKELLETTFLNVKEITDRVGVKDRSHFTRDFKKAYGLSPTQYRARLSKRCQVKSARC